MTEQLRTPAEMPHYTWCAFILSRQAPCNCDASAAGEYHRGFMDGWAHDAASPALRPRTLTPEIREAILEFGEACEFFGATGKGGNDVLAAKSALLTLLDARLTTYDMTHGPFCDANCACGQSGAAPADGAVSDEEVEKALIDSGWSEVVAKQFVKDKAHDYMEMRLALEGFANGRRMPAGQRAPSESTHRSGVQDHDDVGELPRDVRLAKADHSDSGTRAPAKDDRTPHGTNAAQIGGAPASTGGREGSAAPRDSQEAPL